ncbi:right-handed parallel beta-helix repeat-containing protein [Ferruginibacter sp. SUN002]|uniref:right-handed parallel beta-helix repeat-containing protein n=1 Tax=Ferruginibacter sp. SUN002 TaxID=2937789 RepID=UPI003D36FC55
MRIKISSVLSLGKINRCCKILVAWLGLMAFTGKVLSQNKWVDIGDFGIVADNGQVDNYAFFDAAFDHAEKNNIKNIRIPAGVFYISRGFLLNDSITITGAGIDKTILRLINNLPARTDEARQTAIFTGKRSYSLNQSAATKNITIQSLSIDLQKPEKEFNIENFAMLGGIRLINAMNCIIDSVKIINPQKFGIGLFATKTGKACSLNIVKNCVVEMQGGWYLQMEPFIIPRSNETCIGIQVASYEGYKNNGAATTLNRKNKHYVASKTKKNIIMNNTITGGSHGISLPNSCNNSILNNRIEGCSNRGIIIISCSDNNLIERNTIINSGSTAIHLAFNCNYNKIKRNTIDGILGVEGDGIKSYINCNNNIITENIVKNFALTGIRVSHGANNNTIKKNYITGNAKDNQTGIKVIANNKNFYADGMKFNNKLTAKGNICIDNTISNVGTGITVGDEMNLSNSIQNNTVSGNTFKKVSLLYKKKK